MQIAVLVEEGCGFLGAVVVALHDIIALYTKFAVDNLALATGQGKA